MPSATVKPGMILGARIRNSTNRFPGKRWRPSARPAGIAIIADSKVTGKAMRKESKMAGTTCEDRVPTYSHARRLQVSGSRSGKVQRKLNDQISMGIKGPTSQIE